MAITVSYTHIPVPDNVRQLRATSEFISSLDIMMPQHRRELIKRYGSQKVSMLTDLIEIFNLKEPVAGREFYHHEESFLHEKVVCSIGTLPSGTAPATFTVNPNFVDSAGRTRIRKGDIIHFRDGHFNALVTAVFANSVADADSPAPQTFTAIPYKTWSFASSANPSSLTFSIIGRESAMGSQTADKSLMPKVNKITSSVMIVDESFTMTGSAATDEIWFQVTDANGRVLGYAFTYKGEADTALRFENYQESLMIFGERATNPNLTGLGYIGTEGLIDTIKKRGITATNTGTLTLADIDQIIVSMVRFKAAEENIILAGIGIHQQFDDMLAQQTSTSIDGKYFGSFNNDNDTFIDLGFAGFRRSGYKFALKRYDLFNEYGFGAATNHQNNAIIVPMGRSKDPVTGFSIPAFSKRYKALGNYSREREVWRTGGANGVYTNNVDEIRINYRSEIGYEFFGMNRFVYIQQ